MKKCLYIEFSRNNEVGVKKKVVSQIKAIKNIGYSVSHSYLEYNNKRNSLYFDLERLCDFKDTNIVTLTCSYIEMLYKINRRINKGEFSDIYIRYFLSFPWTIAFLYSIKNKVERIFIEVPTYPYRGEISNYLIVLIDDIFSKFIRCFKKVNIVTTSYADKIFDIIPIKISNGIDLNVFCKEKEIEVEKPKNTKFKLLSVSGLCAWHGLERMIVSIADCPCDVIFYIAGSGPEENFLKDLTKSLGLMEKVFFLGNIQGEDLNTIYSQCDIGVGSLGMYKINIDSAQPLKNREYAAAGLPFILGFNDYDFDECDYVYKVGNDNSRIDLVEIIKWYTSKKFDRTKIRENSSRFSWNIQMKKVFEANK